MNCQHTGCACQVDEAQEFCGDYCRDHASEAGHAEHECECDHPACSVAMSGI